MGIETPKNKYCKNSVFGKMKVFLGSFLGELPETLFLFGKLLGTCAASPFLGNGFGRFPKNRVSFLGEPMRFWEMPVKVLAIPVFTGKTLFTEFPKKKISGKGFFTFLGKYYAGRPGANPEVMTMRKRNYKGRCEKRIVEKSKEVCRTYDEIQKVYLDRLQNCEEIKEIRCNVRLEGSELEDYTSDFVCVKEDADLLVRECVFRKYLTKPMTVKLLDASRAYWERHGVTDWGLVIDEEK